MGDFQTTRRRRLSIGWLLPLVLLTLPNCILPAYEYVDDSVFDPGPAPHSAAIMCDIPKVPDPSVSQCATADEVDKGMAIGHAAVAINSGEINNELALDYSEEALNECGGLPKKVNFYGTFPDGLTVCLNCDEQIHKLKVYADANAACQAKCQDLLAADGLAEGAEAFCKERAHVSVNFNPKECFEGFCTNGGTPLNLPDPRRKPEDLKWTDLVNTNLEDNGFTVKFYTPVDPNGEFNGGAASEQLITEGDAWIEFEAGETGVSHAIGVRTSCPDITTCPDQDATLKNMPLLLSLNSFNNDVNVVGVDANGVASVVAGPYSPYAVGERFRIYVEDHHDGTADLSFSRLNAPCVPGTLCSENKFYLHPVGTGPKYPLRLDVAFREANASLKNVTIMRIIKK